MKKGFIIYLDSLTVLDELDDNQTAILFRALRDYNLGKEPQLDFAMRMAFLPFKNQFIRDNEEYQKTCERNRTNGSKGGRPKNPTEPTETQKTHMVLEKPKKADKDKDTDKDIDKIDFVELLNFMNLTFGRKFKAISKQIQSKYQARLKDGYTKKDILTAIINCKNNSYHIEKNYQYCTPEFFSRTETLDKYSEVIENPNRLIASHPIIID